MKASIFLVTVLGFSTLAVASILPNLSLPTIPPLIAPTRPPANASDCGTGPISEGPEYGVCGYDKTGNLMTDGAETFGNMLLPLGNCYCRTDCYPSQITCRRDSLAGMAMEQMAIAAYIAELYYFHCYCPNQKEEYCPKTNLILDNDVCPDHPDSPYVLLNKFNFTKA